MTSKSVAVLGGDKRELIIAALFEELGCRVRMFGTRADEATRHLVVGSLAEALAGAEVLVTPMPGTSGDYGLYAPHAESPLWLDEAALSHVAEGATYFGGRSTPAMQVAGQARKMVWMDMGDDDYIQVQHSIPTSEGAISVAIAETAETIHGANCLVIGYGRIGTVLAADLRGIGADVTVAARRVEVRARAVAAGHRGTTTTDEDLAVALSGADIVFVTTSSMVLHPSLLATVPAGTLVVDLASPPGGLDHPTAKELGLHVVWARGQADTAAAHSARAQYTFMLDKLGLELPKSSQR